jgi:hypothetical protein
LPFSSSLLLLFHQAAVAHLSTEENGANDRIQNEDGAKEEGIAGEAGAQGDARVPTEDGAEASAPASSLALGEKAQEDASAPAAAGAEKEEDDGNFNH